MGCALVYVLKDLSAAESGSMQSCLKELSECLAGLEDYRQTLVSENCFSYVILDQSLSARFQVDRIEAKAMKPLLEYENVCKKARVGEAVHCLCVNNVNEDLCVCVCVCVCARLKG